MVIAPWRPVLARALHRNRSQPQARYCQLATVSESGFPANRTVVFRGFVDPDNQLKIVTDARSRKVAQIQHQPWGEICWYFSKTREQFRLAGELVVVDKEHSNTSLQKERQLAWQNLSDAARVQFTYPAPGKPRNKDPQAFLSPSPENNQPLANFCLLLLNPKRVEHLQLRSEPHSLCLYCLDNAQSWSAQELNP